MSPASIEIRPAEPADIAQIAVLFDAYRQFYEQASDLNLATSFIAARLHHQDAHILLAEQDGKLIGFCQLYPSFCSILAAPIFVLYDLFVTPTARKTGAGRALLQAAEQLALRLGKARLDLSNAKNNLAAQSLYESQGWRRDEMFYTYTRQPGLGCNLGDYGLGEFID